MFFGYLLLLSSLNMFTDMYIIYGKIWIVTVKKEKMFTSTHYIEGNNKKLFILIYWIDLFPSAVQIESAASYL